MRMDATLTGLCGFYGLHFTQGTFGTLGYGLNPVGVV